MSIRQTQLWSAVAHIFQETQTSTGSIQVQSVRLQRLHLDALANGALSLFTKCYIDCLMQIVTVKRTEKCADLVMAFVKNYGKLVSPSEEASEEEAEPWFAFFEEVIRFFLKGFTARHAIVRYRSMNIVDTLLPLVSLDDEMLQDIQEKAIARCRDRDASVRGQAVIILALLDSDDEVNPELAAAMIERLQHDPVAEVRRSAALNIRHTKQSLPIVLGRVRDVNTTNRRVIFTKILPSIADFRHLSIATREKVLRTGLQDRDANIKHQAGKLVVNQWLPRVDNNIVELLQRLDVMSSSDVAELALGAFFDARPDILHSKFDFNNPEFWREVWPEHVVMLRCFIEYARKHKLADLLETSIPELIEFANHISEYWKRARDEEDPERKPELQFVLDELLRVASLLDYSDEEGRRRMVSVLNDILLAPSAPSDTTIANIIAVHRLLSLHDGDFLLSLCELVSDIQDTLREPTGETRIDYDSDENALMLSNVLTCLSVIKAGLERISSVNEHESYLDTLFAHVLPAARSPSYDVRTRATVCANLICLASSHFAESQLGGFYESVEELANYESPSEDDLELSECELLMRCMVDLMLVHKQPEFVAKLGQLFTKFIVNDNSPRLIAAAAYGLSKLMLAGLINDVEIFKQVYLAYLYTSVYAVEHENTLGPTNLLQQQLSLFVRAFCLETSHKELLASVTSELFTKFFEFMEDHPETKGVLTPTKILAQIVDLTAPKDNPESNAHLILAQELVKLLAVEQDKKTQRVLVSWMLKLELVPRPSSLVAYVDLSRSIEALKEGDDVSAGAMRHLDKFLDVVRGIIESYNTANTEPNTSGPATTELATTEPATPRRRSSDFHARGPNTPHTPRSPYHRHTPGSSPRSPGSAGSGSGSRPGSNGSGSGSRPASRTNSATGGFPAPPTMPPMPPSPTPLSRLSGGHISTGSSLEIVSGESFTEVSPPALDNYMDVDMTDAPF